MIKLPVLAAYLNAEWRRKHRLSGGGGPSPVQPTGSWTFKDGGALPADIVFSRASPAWTYDGQEFAGSEARVVSGSGLLIEGGRLRINLNPRDLSVAPPWIHGSGISSVARDAEGIDGAANAASTVTVQLPDTEAWVYQIPDVTENTEYTFSFSAKAGTATGTLFAIYDVTNAAFIAENVPYDPGVGEFARISHTFTTPAGCTSVHIYPLRDAATAGTVIIDAVQLEQGAFASTPVLAPPDTPGQRDADVANALANDFDFNPIAGLLVVEFLIPDARSGVGSFTLASFHDGTTDNEIRMVWSSDTNQVQVLMTTGGVQQASITLNGTAAPGASHKCAVAYDTNNDQIYGSLDGNDDEVAMGSLQFPTQAIQALEFGNDPTGMGSLYGWLADVAYYPEAPDLTSSYTAG